MVHGVWSDPNGAWKKTGFKQCLQRRGFLVSTVDYIKHNAETFDPKAERKIGNQAIVALKSRILKVLEGYNKKYISASQVDIVKSYAIAGSWKPDATTSYKIMEEYFRNVLGNPFFSLDRDGFHEDNDLQVSISSQLGGLDGKHRRSEDKNPPKYGAIYMNTLHSSSFKINDNKKVSAELCSTLIQEDVANLLGSSDDNFAVRIGDVSF